MVKQFSTPFKVQRWQVISKVVVLQKAVISFKDGLEDDAVNSRADTCTVQRFVCHLLCYFWHNSKKILDLTILFSPVWQVHIFADHLNELKVEKESSHVNHLFFRTWERSSDTTIRGFPPTVPLCSGSEMITVSDCLLMVHYLVSLWIIINHVRR